MREVGEAFQKGVSTPGAVELAARLGVDARALRAAVAPLIEGGILVEPEEPQGYLPAAALGALPLERVLAALADGGSGEGTR